MVCTIYVSRAVLEVGVFYFPPFCRTDKFWYMPRTYVTEELLMDRKKKQLSGQLIFDDSVKRLWAIRRYGNVVCLTCFLFCRACVWEIEFSVGHYQLVVSSLTITSWLFGLGEQDKGTDRCVMVLGSHSSVAPGGCYHLLFGGMTIRDPGTVGWAISIDCCVL